MSRIKTKYHYFYKIVNKINNHYYYGVHNTNNINDGYMGGGKRLHHAYKKYGIENFEKTILKYFDTAEEAFKYESEIVTEQLVQDSVCYNVLLGGIGWNTHGFAPVIDNDGNCFLISKNDSRYLSGDFSGVNVGSTCVKDNNGHCLRVKLDDSRFLSGELVSIAKNKVLVKNSSNKTYLVDINDPRYVSGELVPIWTGRKHTEETKQKMKDTHKKNKHQQGEKNSQYGTCWIHNNNSENKKIKKEELEQYISNGWIKGRIIKLNIGR